MTATTDSPFKFLWLSHFKNGYDVIKYFCLGGLKGECCLKYAWEYYIGCRNADAHVEIHCDIVSILKLGWSYASGLVFWCKWMAYPKWVRWVGESQYFHVCVYSIWAIAFLQALESLSKGNSYFTFWQPLWVLEGLWSNFSGIVKIFGDCLQ